MSQYMRIQLPVLSGGLCMYAAASLSSLVPAEFTATILML